MNCRKVNAVTAAKCMVVSKNMTTATQLNAIVTLVLSRLVLEHDLAMVMTLVLCETHKRSVRVQKNNTMLTPTGPCNE